MRDILKKEQKASFTVEASLLMPVILIITIMLIYLGFFVYNRCIMTQKTYIAAFRGSMYDMELRENQVDTEVYAREELSHLYDKKILTGGGVQSWIECDAKEVKVKSELHMVIPFITLLKKQGYQNGWHIQIEKKAKLIDEVAFIRNCRKLEKLGRDNHN